MKKLIISLALLLVHTLVFAQIGPATNLRKEKPFGIALNLLGPSSVVSLSVDYYITHKVNIEAGAGLFGSYGGSTYHFNGDKPQKWTLYTGLYRANIGFIADRLNIIYLPVGYEFIDPGGSAYNAEVAYAHVFGGKSFIWGGIKLGFHF